MSSYCIIDHEDKLVWINLSWRVEVGLINCLSWAMRMNVMRWREPILWSVSCAGGSRRVKEERASEGCIHPTAGWLLTDFPSTDRRDAFKWSEAPVPATGLTYDDNQQVSFSSVLAVVRRDMSAPNAVLSWNIDNLQSKMNFKMVNLIFLLLSLLCELHYCVNVEHLRTLTVRIDENVPAKNCNSSLESLQVGFK